MSLADSSIPKYTGSKTKARQWLLQKKKEKPTTPLLALMPGNCVFIPKYVAVTATFWDYNPVVLIIRSGGKYVFGLNLNWLSRIEKRKLQDLFKRWNVQTNSRLKNAALFRQLKRYKFAKSAYRLYFKEQIQKSRIFKLTNAEIFQVTSLNLLNELADEKL